MLLWFQVVPKWWSICIRIWRCNGTFIFIFFVTLFKWLSRSLKLHACASNAVFLVLQSCMEPPNNKFDRNILNGWFWCRCGQSSSVLARPQTCIFTIMSLWHILHFTLFFYLCVSIQALYIPFHLVHSLPHLPCMSCHDWQDICSRRLPLSCKSKHWGFCVIKYMLIIKFHSRCVKHTDIV